MRSPLIHRLLTTLLSVALLSFFTGCDRSKPVTPEAKAAFENVIPRPTSAQLTGMTFFLTGETTIFAEGEHEEVKKVAAFLAGLLNPATGFETKVQSGERAPDKDVIMLSLTQEEDFGDEGYDLTITEDQVRISANKPAGLFYGVQTLRQLLPTPIESQTTQDAAWEIATGTIRDSPKYAWRGSMLDVARHFFPVEDVKRYIDLISMYKINRFHMHLSDDQGWRIEIKSWPNLTQLGAVTEVGGGEGGYYTQEQYKEIVAYAQDRFVTVIPEIDLPGHINAALVSYPELNVNPSIRREPGIPDPKEKPVPGQLYTGIRVGFSTLDITKPITFEFVEGVLGELAAITPGPYLHIGGDEAAVTKKPDYIAFINRFKEIVEANGKQMIGWEEIAQAAIDSTVVVQHWHSSDYAKMAAEKGAKMILSPATKVYLDMQYDSTTKIGLHWAAYIEVDTNYSWDPTTWVEGLPEENILGVEAPLWTETVQNMDDIEYLVFPRLPGVAEIGWSQGERNWDEYRTRLGAQAPRWETMGVDFYRSPKVDWAGAPAP